MLLSFMAPHLSKIFAFMTTRNSRPRIKTKIAVGKDVQHFMDHAVAVQ